MQICTVLLLEASFKQQTYGNRTQSLESKSSSNSKINQTNNETLAECKLSF